MGKEKLSAVEILNAFFDENTFVETDAYLKGASGEAEAVTGYGTVDGATVFAFAQDVTLSGGAMSAVQSKKITALYKNALKTGAPVVGFFDSKGGRLSEKYDLMNAYGEILKSASRLSGVVPQICVVLGACLGTSALIASSADFIIMTKDAELSVNTSGENADADANLKAGVASVVAKDENEAVEKAKTLLSYLPSNNLEPAPAFEAVAAYEKPENLARAIADDETMFGISCGFGENVCTPFARVDGMTVGIVRTKGGVLAADDCLKITKMVRFCDAFSIPIITFVDAEGFCCLRSASGVSAAYAEATTAKISVINGTAVGGVYIALAGASNNADAVFATADAVISPVAPKAAALLLSKEIGNAPEKDQDALCDSFVKANLTAEKAAGDGYVDDIVDETTVRFKVIAALNMLSSKRVATLPKKHTTIL